MADDSNNLVLAQLREMRAETADFRAAVTVRFDAVDKRLGKVEHNIALLADGMLSLRRDVEMLTLASAGHGERLAHVEARLDSIDRHLRLPGKE